MKFILVCRLSIKRLINKIKAWVSGIFGRYSNCYYWEINFQKEFKLFENSVLIITSKTEVASKWLIGKKNQNTPFEENHWVQQQAISQLEERNSF